MVNCITRTSCPSRGRERKRDRSEKTAKSVFLVIIIISNKSAMWMDSCMCVDGMRKKFISLSNKRRICYALLLSLWLYHAYHELNWVYFFIYMCRKKIIFLLFAVFVEEINLWIEKWNDAVFEGLVCTVQSEMDQTLIGEL